MAVIVAATVISAVAAKAATSNIPIVFVIGEDPQRAGLVTSLNRPGGNTTGASFYAIPVTGKRLALLRELVPSAETIAVLQDPNFAAFQAQTREIEAAMAISCTASAIAELGTSTMASTPSTSIQRRAIAAPISVLFWWSSGDGHWAGNGFTDSTVPATGLRAVGPQFGPLAFRMPIR